MLVNIFGLSPRFSFLQERVFNFLEFLRILFVAFFLFLANCSLLAIFFLGRIELPFLMRRHAHMATASALVPTLILFLLYLVCCFYWPSNEALQGGKGNGNVEKSRPTIFYDFFPFFSSRVERRGLRRWPRLL